MTTSRQQRFEIDLDDIERQLRRAVEPVPTGRPDPLAELARIVGQDDPFRDILAGPGEAGAGGKSAAPAAGSTGSPATPNGRQRIEPTLTSEDREVLSLPAASPAVADGEAAPAPSDPAAATADAAPPAAFDPVRDAFGSPENAVDQGDFLPLRPRRSRARLVMAAAAVGVGLAGTAGFLLLRNGGGGQVRTDGGAPPVVKADTAPLKVVPADPGGVDIPNQDRQIYDRLAQEPRSRLVDRQEQPLDVREAARALPPAPATVVSPSTGGSAGSGQVAAGFESTPLNSVTNALGAPRRVRTVTVRPDGTPFTGEVATAAPLPASPTALPPPVSVATVPVPLSPSPAGLPAPSVPDASAAPPPSGPVVDVLPPARPKNVARSAALASPQPASEAPAARDMAGSSESGIDPAPVQIAPRAQRNAARVAAAPQPAVSPDQAAPATGGGYVVNLATRSNEARARSYSGELSKKYAGDFGGRQPSVVREDVDGKPGFRVRIGPVSSRQEAEGICDRVKSAGGSCSVASGN